MLSRTFQFKPLLLLREAFVSLLPVVLVTNTLVMFSGLTALLERWGVTGASAIHGDELNRLYFFLIPLFINLSLSTLLAKEKDLDQIGTLLISMVCFFRGAGFLNITDSAEIISQQGSILTSIPYTWLSVSLLYVFTQQPLLRLANERSEISPRLKKSLKWLQKALKPRRISTLYSGVG